MSSKQSKDAELTPKEIKSEIEKTSPDVDISDDMLMDAEALALLDLHIENSKRIEELHKEQVIMRLQIDNILRRIISIWGPE